MSLRIVQVDAFTDRRFAGNPAAVCMLRAERDAAWMQQVALEMNLSETSFLVREGDVFRLRWFTPVAEVDLCGHATLASAHVLWEFDHVDPGETLRFQTRSGGLQARRAGDWIEMDFPDESASQAEAPAGLAEALGAAPLWVGRNRENFLVEVESEAVVRALTPDFKALQRLSGSGYIVTARADGGEFDFVSRYFAPSHGIDEDPVTGSAHCTLGPFWAERLGRAELTGFQASARGGVVKVAVGDGRVLLLGQAVTVLVGELLEDEP